MALAFGKPFDLHTLFAAAMRALNDARANFVRMGSSALILILIAGAIVNASDAQAQIKAEVEPSPENGYGRIVFTFEQMPEYTKTISGTILVLSFKEPVSLDVTPIAKQLSQYIAVARLDPDGSALRFAMLDRLKVNIIEAGNKLFVDLLPRNWVGLPPSLPPQIIRELARLSKEAEARKREEERQRKLAREGYTLKIRVGEYKTFSRLVFKWNKFVTAALAREANLLRLKFNVRADANLSHVKSALPPFLKDISIKDTPDGMAFLLVVDPKANVRGFREGLNYVIDLTGANAAIARAAEAALKEAGAPVDTSREEVSLPSKEKPAPVQTGVQDDSEDTASEDNVAPAKKTESEKQQADNKNNWSADLKVERQASNSEKNKTDGNQDEIKQANDVKPDAPVTSYATEEDELAEIEKNDAGPQDMAVETPAMKTEPPSAKKAMPVDKAEKADTAKVANAQTAAEQPQEAKAEEAADKSQMKKGVSAEKREAGLRLSFGFKMPTTAAVFTRGKTVWLVFDTKEPMNTSRLKEQYPDIISSVQQEVLDDAKVIRIKLKKASLAAAESRGRKWNIDIGQFVNDKAKPLTLTRSIGADRKSTVKIPLHSAAKVHWLNDPELGDRLAVVTSTPPTQSLLKPYDLVEFKALPTAHGVAVKPLVDDLILRTGSRQVVISRAKGELNLSAEDDEVYPTTHRLAIGKQYRTGFIDFVKWQQGGIENFEDELSKLENAIAMAQEAKRKPLQLQLARLFISHQLAPEVLGMLRLITDKDPEENSNPSVNILRGVANTMMGRYRMASKDLNVRALENDNDAALWRGLISVHEEEWNRALQQFSEGAGALPDYPVDVQTRFRLGAARAAIERKLWSRTASELAAIPQVPLPETLTAEADLMRGRYYEGLGRTEEAIDAYNAAIKTGVRSAEAEGRLYTVDLRYRKKEIDVIQALKELEALSIAWRGDNTELRVLRRLAQFYVRKGNYRQAFNTMKNAIKAFPDAQLAMRIQDDMKEVFRNLFLYNKDKKLPITAAIGLFYDYRELTPPGRLGDELVRRLADRLISIDLLDQAAELLEHQVANRLTGAARSQVATRLAMVYLMNNKPELALRALRRTRQPDLPEKTQRARDVLEARALSELGRSTSALDLLAGMKGDDVERLRADVYWNAKKWKLAGEQFEKILGSKWQDNSKLEKLQRFDVLRAAISYSLAQDRFALNRLRKKFYQKMVDSGEADAFVLVTQPVKSRSKEFDELVKDIAATSTLEAFMKSFKENFDKDQGTGDDNAPAAPTERRPFG